MTIAETIHGPVRGLDDGAVRAFLGVRYAAAPVGELRFRAPRDPAPWALPADATAFGPVCPQPPNKVIVLGPHAVQDEDCLVLNVIAASSVAPGDARPVMVWIHGGAYIFGSASQPLYDARALAATGEVVVVSVNYRLGALGFADLSAFGEGDPNVALHDVLHALRWVRANIAAFGGDPENVTLFGESAGGGIVTTLMTVPSAAGLFCRAIAQSSPATAVYDHGRSAHVGELVRAQLPVGTAAADAPVDAVVRAGFSVFGMIPDQAPGTLAFAPIVDGDLVPEHPVDAFRAGRAHQIPLLLGTNRDESALFRYMASPLLPIAEGDIRAMFAAMAAERPELAVPAEPTIRGAYDGLGTKALGLAVARDLGFRLPALWIAEAHSRVAPVHLYRFDWSTRMLRLLRLGATHATELPYLFGTLDAGPRDPTFRLGGKRVARALSARMQDRWRGFARDGDPGWPAYTADERLSRVIDRADRVVADLDGPLRAAWGDVPLGFR